MARGNEEAQQASKSGLGFSRELQGNQRSLFGTLNPALTQDVVAPTGFTPQQKSMMNTAAMETTGGANAGAVGQGSLMAQRTRNAGTADAAIQESARDAGRTLTRASLGTELADAGLKEQKRAAAKGQMGQLYNTSVGGGNEALGEVARNVDANSRAEEQSWNWAKYLMNPIMGMASTPVGGKLMSRIPGLG